MVRMKFFRSCLAVGLLGLMVMVSGCSALDSQADQRLGEACTDEVRLLRASLLMDMIDKHYGTELPDRVADLRAKTDLMLAAVDAGAGVDAAGDSYKAAFVQFAAALFLTRGKDIALDGFEEAVESLRKLPELIADVNEIEARVQIACAMGAPPGVVQP